MSALHEQLTFALPTRPALGRGDFFVSAANAEAEAAIRAQDWPGGKLALYGPAGSGKTHLAHVWAAERAARVISAQDLATQSPDTLAKVSAVAVEDIPEAGGNAAAEQALFHLHNLVLASGGRLLLTGRDAPSHWRLALPDLASRCQGTRAVALGAPDDALLSAVLVKLFADRQISVDHRLITFLVRRIDRSFASARAVVDRLDGAALRAGRSLTRSFAAEILAAPAAAPQAPSRPPPSP